MADKQRLFVDMDGTLATFKPVDELETLYEKGYFRNLPPQKNVVDAVKKILHNNPDTQVNILSAYLSDSQYALDEKNAWLDQYLPEIDEGHRIFLPCGVDKKAYIPGGVRPTDYLLDDYTQNLTMWEPPARGIKLLNGINHTRGTWKRDRLRFDKDPDEIASDILRIMRGDEHVIDPLPGRMPEAVFADAAPEPDQPAERKPGRQDVIQSTIQFYDTKAKAKRLLLIADVTENGEYVCFNITSAKADKDQAKYPSLVPVCSSPENHLNADSFVKCGVEYIISTDSVYSDVQPMPIRIGDADFARVMQRYSELKAERKVKRFYNSVEPKRDEFEKLKDSVISEVEKYKQKPELIAELVDFRARFYRYSFNNTVLIRKQNPYATFVASFKKWSDLGYHVNKGEHGIRILAPYEVTYFRKGDAWVNVRRATREETDKIFRHEFETRKTTYFVPVSVFDISQTNCPPADYPKYYDFGYASQPHAELYAALKAFAITSGFDVVEKKIDSIALKGFYDPKTDVITLNDKLGDTEKLATLTHEFSHGLLHKTSTQPKAVVEFEAECLSHMFQRRLGLPISDANKNYLAHYYAAVKPDEIQLDRSFQRISKAYAHTADGMDKALETRGVTIEHGRENRHEQSRQQDKAPRPEAVNGNFLEGLD